MNPFFRKSSPKRRIRDEVARLLSSLSFHDLIGKSGDLSARFFDFVQAHETVFRGSYIVSFCPFGNEPQINIEKEGGGEPYRVGYVRIEDWEKRTMSARACRRDTPDLWEVLEPARGVRIDQPRGNLPEIGPAEACAILVPGIAFSRTGGRLGRGAGFYDRFLQAHPSALRIGIALSEQITEDLPQEVWDEPVDIILTDREIIMMNSYGDWKNHGKITHRNRK